MNRRWRSHVEFGTNRVTPILTGSPQVEGVAKAVARNGGTGGKTCGAPGRIETTGA